MFLRNLNNDILENRINIFINGNNMVIISDSNNYSDLEYVTIFNRHYKLYPTNPFKVDSDIVFNLEKTVNYFRIEEIVINIDITLNDFCIMNCTYCGSNKDSKGRVISLESLINILDKWILYFKTDNINVTLLGGEVALLNEDYLREILHIINDKVNGNINIYTNLKKTSNEIKNFLKLNKRSNLIVSIDGIYDIISERTYYWSDYDTEDGLPIIVQVLNKINRDGVYELHR